MVGMELPMKLLNNAVALENSMDSNYTAVNHAENIKQSVRYIGKKLQKESKAERLLYPLIFAIIRHILKEEIDGECIRNKCFGSCIFRGYYI